MNDNYTHVESNIFYVTENIMGPYEQSAEYELLFNNFHSQLSEHCSCDVICSYATCECLQKSCGENYSTYQGNGHPKYKLIAKAKAYPIMECNESCPCSMHCGNRVVQNGPVDGLQIRSCDKGLGIFATCFIPSGTFICEYAGELITTTQATIRHQNNKIKGKRNYIFCLRELSNNHPLITIVDPGIFGNIGRYINHSCEPNCYVTPVRCESPIPKLAIFAHADISPDDEITFHYGLNDEIGPQTASDRIRCLCRTKSCSGFMPFHMY